MNEALYLGVDGGASGCRARIRDGAGRLVGEGKAGPANVWLDLSGAIANIAAAARAAAAAGGLADADLRRCRAGLGLAGVVSAEARERVLAQDLPFVAAAVDNDAYTACLGAHDGADGAILILGTGSCGLALVDGKRTTIGGWGMVLSDDGSGARIGQEALRGALRALEGVEPRTPLATALLSEFGNSAERLAAWAAEARPGSFAKFAPLVFQHGAAGDPLARKILGAATADVCRLLDRLSAAGAPSISLVGGLAGSYRAWLPTRWTERLRPPRGDAMDGAILMARQASAVAVEA